VTATVPSTDPLTPVRDALLERAHEEVDRLLSRAEQDAEETLADARGEADDLRAQGRAQGEADAEAVLVSARTRARRQARATVLAAQRDTYDELRRRVHGAAQELRDDPGYDALRDRLVRRARELLGPDAELSEPPDGGVVAEAGGRRFVCTLADLADAALGAVDVEELWSP
jgi:vacuolar-type H+-ATPase subunit E/Vma4